jgi:hypothetical protein
MSEDAGKKEILMARGRSKEAITADLYGRYENIIKTSYLNCKRRIDSEAVEKGS